MSYRLALAFVFPAPGAGCPIKNGWTEQAGAAYAVWHRHRAPF
jgi:hypothetical protein